MFPLPGINLLFVNVRFRLEFVITAGFVIFRLSVNKSGSAWTQTPKEQSQLVN
jgi:hypothetical protein